MTRCPHCNAANTQIIGYADADEAILGVDETLERCLDCRTEWVRERGGTRAEILNQR